MSFGVHLLPPRSPTRSERGGSTRGPLTPSTSPRRALAEADFDRTPSLLTTFNHAALGDAVGWVDRLDEIDQSTLIVHGTEDPVLPYAHALALQAALPAATLLTLEGSGHELHRADWPAILDAVEQHTAPGPRRPR
jgi:pimeloyl-ACP methyl ester carboxylesterase